MDILRAAIIGSMFVVIICNHCLIFSVIQLMPLIHHFNVDCWVLYSLSIVNSIHPWNWLLIVPLLSWYLQSPSSLFQLYLHHPSIVDWPSYLYEFHACSFQLNLQRGHFLIGCLSLCPQFIDCISRCNHVDELWSVIVALQRAAMGFPAHLVDCQQRHHQPPRRQLLHSTKLVTSSPSNA